MCGPGLCQTFCSKDDGSIDKDNPLESQLISSDAHYSFNTKSLGILNSSLNIQYIVAADGCNGESYKRPITNFNTAQDIDAKSTVIAEVINANSLVAKKLNEVPRNKIETLIKLISGTSTSEALESLTTQASNSSKFTEIFGTSPTVIRSASPEVNATIPSSLNELAVNYFSSQAIHVDPNYSKAYIWKLDGVIKSTQSYWNYIPGANEAGNHSVDLYVGQNNDEGNIDLTKPYYKKTFSIVVNNNILPTAPNFALNASNLGPVSNSTIQVDLSTGTLSENCASFSHLAITESNSYPGIMQFNIDCTIANTQTESVALSSGDGNKTLYLWAIDNEGNISAAKTISLELDTLPPVVNLNLASSIIKGGNSELITLGASDAGTGLQSFDLYFSSNGGSSYSLISHLGIADTSYSWSVPVIDIVNGKLKLVATDLTSLSSTVYSSTFGIDSTSSSAPTIARTSSATSNSSTVAISTTCIADYAKILYSQTNATPAINDASWETCASTKNFTVSTGDAVKTIYAFTKDSVGNISSSSNIIMTLDTVAPSAPVATLTSASTTSSSSLTFTIADCADRPAVLVSESVIAPLANDSTWQTCSTASSAILYTLIGPISQGAHTLYVYAKDAAGNISVATTASMIYDSANPAVSIGNITGPLRGGSQATITYASSDATSGVQGLLLEYAANGTVFSTVADLSGVASPYSWTVPSVNLSTAKLRLTATDYVGNAAVYTTGAFTIDSTSPVLTQTSFSSGNSINTNTATFGGSCESGLLITVSGADSSSTTCNGTWSYTSTSKTSDATYSFTFSQTDAAGNTGSVSAQFIRDTVAPSLTQTLLASGTSQNTNTATFGGNCETGVTINISGTDTSSVTCPAGTWTYTTASKTADATYSYTFTETDSAGNTANITVNWIRDTVAPTLSWTLPTANSQAQSQITATGDCETGRNINYSGTGLLSAFSQVCSGGTFSQTLYFSLGEGSKTIAMSQTDAAGNTTTINRDFIRDYTPPTLTQTLSSSTKYSNQNTVSFGGACEAGFSVVVSGANSGSLACNGAWSYTTTAETSDGTYNYTFTETDSAGNSSSVSVQFIRDTVGPALTITGAGPFANAANTYTFSGTCESGRTITISDTDSSTTACTGGAWSYTTSSQTTDGARGFTFTQTDVTGNSTSLSTTWTRDTTGPALTITQTSTLANTAGTATFSGNCQTGLSIAITGADTSSLTCPAGTWSYTTSNQTTDALRTYTFTQTNAFSISTIVTGNWKRDTTPPTLSLLTINSGALTTSSRIVNISLQASDSSSKITHFCLKLTNSGPNSSDSCWIPVNSPSPNITPAASISFSGYLYGLDIADDTYTIYSWVIDELGNISAISGGGTASIDKASIQMISPTPSVIDWTKIANTDTPSSPILNSEQVASANQNVYIKWKITDSQNIPAGNIRLYFTTNETDNSPSAWTEITTAGINNGINGSCTLAAGGTGCYVFNAPTSSYFRAQLRVVNSAGLETRALASPINAVPFTVLAGNTEIGIGGSGKSAIFQNDLRGNARFADKQTLVVTNDGTVYFRDYIKGILKVSSTDGKVSLFIPTTGVSTGDDGPAINATLTHPQYIALDYQNRLLIFDNDRIRRVDLSLATPSITTIIGGGSDESDTVANPLLLKVYPPESSIGQYNDRHSRIQNFITSAPNGDIYFRSDFNYSGDINKERRLRIYKESTGGIQSLYYSGTGNSNAPDLDISTCASANWGLAFNLSSGALEYLRVLTYGWYNSGNLSCFVGVGADTTAGDVYTRLNPVTGASEGPHFNSDFQDRTFTTTTGMDGKIYSVNREQGRIIKFNHDPTTSTAGTAVTIAGTGTPGYCADDTVATSCQIAPQSIFITQQGQVYFTEQGLIRTIASDGKIKTVYGQTLFYGDGGPATVARFGQAQSLDIHTNGGNKIVVFDGSMKRIREFSVGGDIATIAGNGSVADANTTGLASAQGLPGNTSWVRDYMATNHTTGDVYAMFAGSQIGKLNRSTGIWERFFGAGGANPYWTNDGSSATTSYADYPEVVGYSNGNLLVSVLQASSPGYYKNGMFKLIDSTSLIQTHLAGTVEDPYTATMCADGVASSGCTVPVDLGGCLMNYTYDSANSRWLASYCGWSDIVSFGIGQTKQTVMHIDHPIEAFAYNSSTGAIYYCGTDGKLYKKIATEVELTLPNSSISCQGNSLIYDSNRNVLVFPFVQNGLWGIGEYANP